MCIAFILWLSDSKNLHRRQASWRSRLSVRLMQELRKFGKQRMLCFLYVVGVFCIICAMQKGDCAYNGTPLPRPSRPTSKHTAALQVTMDIPLEICNLVYGFVVDSSARDLLALAKTTEILVVSMAITPLWIGKHACLCCTELSSSWSAIGTSTVIKYKSIVRTKISLQDTQRAQGKQWCDYWRASRSLPD